MAWPHRWERISTILQHYNADIVSLQEVDHYESHFQPFLKELDYSVFYVRRPRREDGVLVAFKIRKFRLLHEEHVYFDDLAEVKSLHLPTSIRDRLRKQNVALTLVLKLNSCMMDSETIRGDSFSMSTTHLHWNPVAPDIKLAQALYLIKRIADVHGSFEKPPVASILTGDFNSLPGSQPYMRVLRGTPFLNSTRTSRAYASREACKLFVKKRTGEKIKFLCDSTLSRMVRWMRLLGVDVTLEDSSSQERRSQYNDFSLFFEQARLERRIIVTTSINMLRRSMCPEVFIVNPSSGSLESQVSKLLNFYDVKLNKSDILSICGKCGGRIETCDVQDPRLEGRPIPRDRQLYICTQCCQPYWNGDSESAVSARALRQAQTLFAYIEADRKTQRFGEYHHRSLSSSKILEEDFNGEDASTSLGTSSVAQPVPVIINTNDWLRYRSAFKDVNKHEPMYTNVNGTFRGTLDYIFIGGSCSVGASQVVQSFSRKKVRKAFPNGDWPSDHMLLRADLILPRATSGRSPFARSSSLPSLKTHDCDTILVERW
ncbi:unnamed protein product [Agarophyton chilense]